MTAATTDESLLGPYLEASNGRCALGHPLNGMGRCQPLNDGLEPTTGTPTTPVRTGN